MYSTRLILLKKRWGNITNTICMIQLRLTSRIGIHDYQIITEMIQLFYLDSHTPFNECDQLSYIFYRMSTNTRTMMGAIHEVEFAKYFG